LARLRRVQHEDQLTLEHLDELRSRLIVSLLVLTIGVSVGFWKQHAILQYLLKPGQSALHVARHHEPEISWCETRDASVLRLGVQLDAEGADVVMR
jgi:Sec-independent protein secretion pathway component TatC